MTERAKRRILVVDDDIYTHELFGVLFDHAEVEVQGVKNGREALEHCRHERFDVILTDLRMPVMNGIEFLREFRRVDEDTPVVVITGYGSVETAVEAMKLGAFDYLTKPFDKPETVRRVLQRTWEHKDLRAENRALKARLEGLTADEGFIGTSPAMQEVFRWIDKIAPIDSTVLILGESGTGKELVARTVHRRSRRGQARFLPINCGGLPETLLESTLFGYEKGAFTGAYKTTPGYFEVANGGTLFLDEVESMSPNLQVRLLRVLQERAYFRVGGTAALEADVRIISASKADLRVEVAAGRFREDLFYRLNVLSMTLPPLRDRREDVASLAQFFLVRYNQKLHKSLAGFTEDALRILLAYSWPGNVRELENVMERAVALGEGSRVARRDLPDYLVREASVRDGVPAVLPYEEAKVEFQRSYLQNLMTQAGGNVSRASRLSGIPRQNLYLKLQQAGMNALEFRVAADNDGE
jgi:DNA-binding NtrC family response regulator